MGFYKGDENNRFVLGNKSEKTLFVIGLNPSKANDKQADPTMNRVKEFANQNGFDTFIMLNLYPKITSQPSKLPNDIDCDEDLITLNVEVIKDAIPQNATILAAWGGNINDHKYLRRSLHLIGKQLEKRNCKWLKIGDTQCGDPKHPNPLFYKPPIDKFLDFDFKNYFEHLQF